MECLCAEVLTLGIFDKPLLYKIPSNLLGVVDVGMFVCVPFGRSKTTGIVSKILTTDISKFGFQTKELSNLEYDFRLLGDDLIQLIFWMHRYYLVPYKFIIEAIIPVAIRKIIGAKIVPSISCAKNLSSDELNELRKRSPKQYELYNFLLNSGCSHLKSELKNFSVSALKALLDKGILAEEFQNINRVVYDDDVSRCDYLSKKEIVLTDEQQVAVDDIEKSISSEIFVVHLLQGITGSGKTEVYLRAIRKILEIGGNVIYLVPELVLTPQTVGRIRKGLNLEPSDVVVWHSGLSDGERRDAWLAMSTGSAKIVIGARSAVFAPFKNLKLVIVDEEHETTYKQADMPRYHARDVAVYRSKLAGAVCVLGSATPSVESMFNAHTNKYKLNTLDNRVDGSRLPKIELVDMRYERTSKSKKIISARLAELIEDRLSKCEQIILFLNKRGYSSVVFCNNCDYVATCPHCSTSLTYHKNQNLLRCHICDYIESLPSKCPKCGGRDILQSGVGTQRLYSIVSDMFPDAKIERLDSDTMTTKDGFCRVLNRFGRGEIDILIGTQMISKGLDFPNISLVGIINVDNAMNFPDFRASERVFQSIVQVSGRAGRGDKPGIVAIQTHCPESELIKLAITNDHKNFLKNELNLRSEFFYPPFAHIIRILFSGHNEEKTATFAQNFSDALRLAADGGFDVRGPAPAAIRKTNDKFRFSVMCFTKNVTNALAKISCCSESMKRDKKMSFSVDVDPIDMM